MDLALKIADANAPKLDTGIADKLRGAASSMGPHVVPVGDGEANGMLWRLLATRARLDSSELLALILWVEMAYSAEMSARTTAHLPSGLLQTACSSRCNGSSHSDAGRPRVVVGCAPHLELSASLAALAHGWCPTFSDERDDERGICRDVCCKAHGGLNGTRRNGRR